MAYARASYGAEYMPTVAAILERMSQVLERIGLRKRLRFHDLRHSYATAWVSEGGSMRILSDVLGHADPGFTARVYAHVLPGVEEEMTRRLTERIVGEPQITEV